MAARGSANLAAIPYLGTTDPGATDDATKGISVGSPGLNTTTRAFFLCLDNTIGAARWARLRLDARPPRASSRFYPCFVGAQVTNIVFPAADALYLAPFEVTARETWTLLAARVATAGSGDSAAKMCIYRSDAAGLPFGAPLVADTAGQATAAVAPISHTFAAVVAEPGLYHAGCKVTGGTRPTFAAIGQSSTAVEDLMGVAVVLGGGTNCVTGRWLANPYASAFPTLTGAEAWEDNTAGGHPIIRRGQL